MTDDPGNTPDLDELLADLPSEQAELEHQLGELAAACGPSEGPFVCLAFSETGLPAPARSLDAPACAEGESVPLQQMKAAAGPVLGELALGAQSARPRVSRLLALPVAERWRPANEEAAYHEVPVIEELLARVEAGSRPPPEEVEAIALLVLQLAPRVRFGAFPSRWVGDFLTQGWLLLAEAALARRDLARASFAVGCAQAQLQTGSGDAALVFEVGLHLAFLDWAGGRAAGAAAAFGLSLKLAASCGDTRREGEVCLWLDLLCGQLGEADRAFGARTRALALLSPQGFEQTLARHRLTIDRLGLVLPLRRPVPAEEPPS